MYVTSLAFFPARWKKIMALLSHHSHGFFLTSSVIGEYMNICSLLTNQRQRFIYRFFCRENVPVCSSVLCLGVDHVTKIIHGARKSINYVLLRQVRAQCNAKVSADAVDDDFSVSVNTSPRLLRGSPLRSAPQSPLARGCSGDLHYDRPRNLPSNQEGRMTDEMKLRKRAM